MDNDVFSEYVERVRSHIEPVVTPELFAEVMEIFEYWSGIFQTGRRGEFTPTFATGGISSQSLELFYPDHHLITCSLNAVNAHGDTVSAYSFTLDFNQQKIVEKLSGDVWL